MANNFKEFFVEELKEVFNAEKQIVEALPTLITATESQELINVFKANLVETINHCNRLKRIFQILNTEPVEVNCIAMEGMIKDCYDTINKFQRSDLRDLALITKVQRIEHYEMAVYSTLRTFAKHLELKEVEALFHEILIEEGNANKDLSKIVEVGVLSSGINHKTVAA